MFDYARYKNFYENTFPTPDTPAYHGKEVADPNVLEELRNFVKQFDFYEKKILDVGSGAGIYQDVAQNYVGLDVTEGLRRFYHKPYFVIDDENNYPFQTSEFDAVITRATLEHIPKIDKTLLEMVRVLKPGGVMLIHAAWQVRPWAAGGYEIKPWKDLGFKGKLIKASIPLRDNILFRLCAILPQRLWRTIKFLFTSRVNYTLEYKKLDANYEIFLVPDSDACNSVDPHAVILWFFAHGCKILNYPSLFRAFFVRSGSLLVRKL